MEASAVGGAEALLRAVGALGEASGGKQGAAGMVVYARSADGSCKDIECGPDSTAAFLYSAAAQAFGRSVKVLTWQGEVLPRDETPLSDLGIGAEAEVMVPVAHTELHWMDTKRGHEHGESYCRPRYWEYTDRQGETQKPHVVTKMHIQDDASAAGYSCNVFAAPCFGGEDDRGCTKASASIQFVGIGEDYDFADAVGFMDVAEGYLWNSGVASVRLADAKVALADKTPGPVVQRPVLNDVLHLTLDWTDPKRAVWCFRMNDGPEVTGTCAKEVLPPVWVTVEARKPGWSFRLV
eukprot:TRINITY_DN60828_c0_g1_i1.p1 TRINITY_DN60828_c0_g1~~TRINITY_DN60828_c0_g1_i1.p1  ORF type:complete len:319 (+),score=91.12 TRINITY_DN60828_c0_g1_i1:76-957(+)